MTQVPVWLQATACIVAIAAGTGSIFFGLFVLWPSIRQSNRAGKRLCEALDRMEKKGVEKLLNDL